RHSWQGLLAPCDLGWQRCIFAEWPSGARRPAPGELLADAAQKTIGPRDVWALGQLRDVARLFQLRRHSLGLLEDLVERYLAPLDGEQAVTELSLDGERRHALAEPARGSGEQAQQIVGILRSQLARKLKVGRFISGESDECVKLVRVEEALVGER